ncbi:MAG: 50S ribosomal protein L13 [Bacillota bacterium]|nr:50S ribosomal protein L13 [Bacillota bacterium]
MQKTYYPKAGERQDTWYVIDAEDMVLGRLASEVARILRGKHKPTYTPGVPGDHVIIVNADKIRLTGNKPQTKIYRRHSGYPGGLKTVTFSTLIATRPERVLEHAVRGMLPRGRMGRQLFRRMRVYAGPQHPHEGQKPVALTLEHCRARS